MPRNPRFLRTACTKRAYTSRDEAHLHIANLLRRQPLAPLNAYVCPVCHYWHVGHRRARCYEIHPHELHTQEPHP